MNTISFTPDECIDMLISIALAEDLGDRGDVTSRALIDEQAHGSIAMCARAAGVLSGCGPARRTLEKVDASLDVTWKLNDGAELTPGDTIATVSGSLRSILGAERVTLNFLQHLSGIATMTKTFVDELKKISSPTIIRDTRKTLPGYRALEKAAVVHGGGENHRMGLFDAFLVKDNHLAGRDLEIIAQRCRDFDPLLPLEIEVDNLEQLKVILEYEPDVILLDNFSVDDVFKAIDAAGEIPLEISGGVTLDNITDYGNTHVKYIAVGALTHSAPALDLGFDAQ